MTSLLASHSHEIGQYDEDKVRLSEKLQEAEKHTDALHQMKLEALEREHAEALQRRETEAGRRASQLVARVKQLEEAVEQAEHALRLQEEKLGAKDRALAHATTRADSLAEKLRHTGETHLADRHDAHERMSEQVHAVEKRLLGRVRDLEVALTKAQRERDEAVAVEDTLRRRLKGAEGSLRDIGEAVFAMVSPIVPLSHTTAYPSPRDS